MSNCCLSRNKTVILLFVFIVKVIYYNENYILLLHRAAGNYCYEKEREREREREYKVRRKYREKKKYLNF
jgi:hypothetical protein